MSNDFFTKGGVPGTSAAGSSAVIRGEYAAIEAAFDKMPGLTGNANKAVVVNAGANALTVTTGTLALAGNFSTIGAYAIALTATGATGVTLPTAGTLATLAGTEEFTNKTLNASVGKGTWTASGTWTLPAVTLGGAVTLNAALTGNSAADITINTNKFTVAASSGNTVIGGTLTIGGTFAPPSLTVGTGGTLYGERIMVAAADQSITSSTTLTDATSLGFAIAANEEWTADFELDMGGAFAAATGFKLAVTVPSGATLNVVVVASPETTTDASTYLKRTTTGGAALDFTLANCAGYNQALVRVSVWVLNSTNAGTVQLQIAQSTSSGTALTLRKGSHGIAKRKT